MTNMESLSALVVPFLINVAAAALIFVVGLLIAGRLANLAAKVMEKKKVDSTLVSFLRKICFYALLVVVIIIALNKLGLNTASLLAVVGAAGLAVGLALKDSLRNFASGVMLILFRPFRVNDYVQAGGTAGTVKEISIFSTELTTPDNQQVIVPNSIIMDNVITNVTAHDTRRLDLAVGIGYGDDIAKSKEVLAGILKNEPRILPEPAPVIAVAELGDSSVNLVIRPWVRTGEYWAIRFDLIERIKQELDRAEITIPFPQRDIHLYQEKEAA